MAIKLNLKKRLTRDSLNLPLLVIKSFIDRKDKDGLWTFFEGLADDENVYTHDKHWLETIVNWTPEGGVSLTESSRWFKLAERVGALDTDREGDFTVTAFQADLIWERMINPLFKLDRLSVAFIEFVQEFQKVTGKHFEEEEPDIDPVDKSG